MWSVDRLVGFGSQSSPPPPHFQDSSKCILEAVVLEPCSPAIHPRDSHHDRHSSFHQSFRPVPFVLYHIPKKAGIITLVLQMAKLRRREPKLLVTAHEAGLLIQYSSYHVPVIFVMFQQLMPSVGNPFSVNSFSLPCWKPFSGSALPLR